MSEENESMVVSLYPVSDYEWAKRIEPVLAFCGIEKLPQMHGALRVLASPRYEFYEVEVIANVIRGANAAQELLSQSLRPHDVRTIAALALSARTVFLGGSFQWKSHLNVATLSFPLAGRCHCGGRLFIELRKKDDTFIICFVCEINSNHYVCL